MCWFACGYHFLTEGDTAGFEAVSHGRQNAFLCHVESCEGHSSLESFAKDMKELPIIFDRESMSLDFMGIHVDYAKNSVNGVENEYPYKLLFDSPYMISEYNSGIYCVSDGETTEKYDFNF